MGCHLCSDRNDQIKIVIGGLSKSGKTVIFFKLTDHPELTHPVPTIGYNSEIITLRNKSIFITDIGTRQPSRASMSLYLAYAKGFVFVIDTSEKSHL
jgi:GTPase SAR1 family protein